MGNNTWVLADLHPDCKPLSCKWIFKRNLKYHKTTDCNETSLIIYIPSMDLKTTFLNGELDKEVYINQPQGFIMPDNENKLFGSYTDDAGSATQKTIPSTMSGYSSVVEQRCDQTLGLELVPYLVLNVIFEHLEIINQA
ncbi:zinc finger, CCHC-type containing protein [Tanacetum coccineum]